MRKVEIVGKNNLANQYMNGQKHVFFKEEKSDLKHIGFLSLKIALKSYFSTYLAVKDNLITHPNSYSFILNDLENLEYNNKYYEASSETIIHFQHFFELVIKDILGKESPLLAVKANTNSIIFHKLINKEEITSDEADKLYSIEFSEAIKCFFELLENDRLKCMSKYNFFKDEKINGVKARDILETLNLFRNRTWHKGMFILKYNALDEFVGKYILPLVKKILGISDYSKYAEKYMFYKEASCSYMNIMNLNVFDKIVEENKLSNSNSGKIAFLKEVGRTFYYLKDRGENNYKYDSIINEQGENGLIIDIKKCPVCGLNTLIHRYDYMEEEEYDVPYGVDPKRISKYESDVKCINCTFQLNKYVENLKSYGYSFEDFWDSYDIFDEE